VNSKGVCLQESFMKKVFSSLLIGIFLLFSSSSSSAEDRSSKYILDNGLTVLITEMPSSPVVSVYALVKAGSATEERFLGTGISHFLEHMLFKGTHGRGVGELAARVQAVGGQINASTGMDYTMYTLTVPYESFDVALDILSDMLMNAAMDAKEVELERTVIFGEMRMRNDDPDRRVSELTFQNVYIRHPYRHPVIGYESLLRGVTRDDIVAYYQTFYVPNNIILSVAGHIDGQAILPKIKESFQSFKRGREVVRLLPEEPPQISSRRYEESYPTDLTRLSMSYSGVSLLDPDLYALDVLATILGQGWSSRLYKDVYKKQGLVYNISSSNYTPVDKGFFNVDALLEQDKVEAVVQAVLRHIEDIKKGGVTQGELGKAKQQVRSQYVFQNQTASSVTYSQAIDEAFAGDPHFSEKYVAGVGRVTVEDIRRVAKNYLVDSALTTVILKPKQKDEVVEKKKDGAVRGSIQRHVLDNGLTVLLREDHTFPLVSIRLSANGGVRQEEAALNGLSRMTASVWIKGTKNFTADQLAEKTESLGMNLDSFSGRNSFGLSLDFLTGQLSTAYELLKELVFAPVFPEEEIVKVREDLKTLIRQREDDIFQSTAHALKETLFLTHPFRLEPEGAPESLDRITRHDLVDFYQQFTAPGNMVLSVFGDINPEDTLKEVERLFGNMKSRDVALKTRQEALPRQLREKSLVMDKEQAMVMFGFQGAALNDKDYYPLEILSSILGSSFSGRLFNNIRNQLGGTYTLGGSFVPGVDTGFIYLYVLTTDKEADKVKGLIRKEIENIQSALVEDKELKDMKVYLKGAFQARQETNASLSYIVGLDELYGLGFERYQRYGDNIDAVTEEDIRRVAQQYLDLNKAAVVVTRPKSKVE
jgi:zinc protease